MKFSNFPQSSKLDANYDDLENSIVDSLSEISVASNLPLNIHNQDLVNSVISDVVSTYLWANDYSMKKGRGDNHFKSSESTFKSGKASAFMTLVDEVVDEAAKKSPQINNFKSRSHNGSVDSAQFISKDDVKSTTKFQIPSLDLSYLNEAKSKSSGDLIDANLQMKTDKEKITANKHKMIYDNIVNKQELKASGGLKVAETKKSELVASTFSIKSEIEALLRELKLLRGPSTAAADSNDYYDQESEFKLNKLEHDKLNAMALNLKELLTRLHDKRKLAKRNMAVEKMSRDEIQAEKIDTQKELLAFEEKHGRPQAKLEKDLMRPLYDHYRKVKRLLAKNTGKITQNSSELQDDDDEDFNNLKDNKHFLNLHSLTSNELIKEKELALLEKAKLKDMIKKYENEFVKLTGRALTKEDREYHKEDFDKYKVVKAKIKLIDALMEKHEMKR